MQLQLSQIRMRPCKQIGSKSCDLVQARKTERFVSFVLEIKKKKIPFSSVSSDNAASYNFKMNLPSDIIIFLK